jgi:predicted Zn-dependent protease
MGTQRRPLTVGDPQAVEVLDRKIRARVRDEFAWRRLLHSAATARRRHRQVRNTADMGFYHGLLTGYAVALKTLEGKVGQGRH